MTKSGAPPVVNAFNAPIIIYLVTAVIILWILLFSQYINTSRWANAAAGIISLIFITLFLLLIVNIRVHKAITWFIVAVSLIIELFAAIWFGFLPEPN